LFVDEISFVKSINTGLFTPKSVTDISAYYANGEIRIANYSGNVRVIDLAGKVIASKLTTDGKIAMTLNRGIYIVTTTTGNAKLIVY